MSSSKRAPAPRRARRPAGRPSGANAEGTREAILAAALEAFAAQGYDATSVRELTRRLGVSHNLVHHHFGTKQALWRAAVDYGFGEQAAHVGATIQRVPAGTALEAMGEAIRQFARLCARLPAVPRIMARESAEDGPRLDYIYQQYLAPSLVEAERFLEQATGEGLRPVELRSLFLLVIGAITAFFFQAPLARRLGEDDPLSDEAISRHVETVLDVVMNGLVERKATPP